MASKLWCRVAVTVAATAGSSVLLGGVALAHDYQTDNNYHNDDAYVHQHDDGTYVEKDTNGGKAGDGGRANATCAVPVGVSAGIIGQGNPVDQCNVQGGTAGDGGTGAKY